MMCLGSVCHVFTTSIDIMYWQKPETSLPTTNFGVCHSHTTSSSRSCWGIYCLSKGKFPSTPWISQWKPSVALHFFLREQSEYHRTKMQFQWSSQKIVIKFFKVPLPIEFLCKTAGARETRHHRKKHQAHIDFRLDNENCARESERWRREIHFSSNKTHHQHSRLIDSHCTVKFQYFPRALTLFFVWNDVNSLDSRSRLPLTCTHAGTVLEKVWWKN